jgi:hypothetical protein
MIGTPEWQLDRDLSPAGINLAVASLLGSGGPRWMSLSP